MSEPKTKKHTASVEAFLNRVQPPERRDEAFRILELMGDAAGEPPAMWGDAIVGFGSYHYVYASGREGDWMRIGFSPRKTNFSLYIMSGFADYEELMQGLGKFKTGKSCLYINKLEDIDLKVLKKLMKASLKYMKKTYPK